MPHETSITISNHLKEEIERWESDIDLQFTGTPIIKNVPDVWTDATPTRIAVVIGRTVLMAELFRVVDIALAEALAAAWGLIFSNNIAHIRIDNLGIAHALAKGHSSPQTINQVFANIFKKPTHGSVTWVPTEDQVADGPTRNGYLSLQLLHQSDGRLFHPWYLRKQSTRQGQGNTKGGA